MTEFSIGQSIVCVDKGDNVNITEGTVYSVLSVGQVMGVRSVTVVGDDGFSANYRRERFTPLPARSNDPDTSKAAAKIKRPRIKDTILDLLDKYKTGLTGQEVAEYSGYRLNSVTPRFAELSRATLGIDAVTYNDPKIKDSGHRRSGQIVWVLHVA